MSKKRPEHVVILGMGPSYVDYHNSVVTQDVKLDVVGDEVWTVNAAAFDHRSDRVFWMDDLKKEHALRPDTIERLDHMGIPIVSTTAHSSIVKQSEAYPINDAARMSMDIFGKVYLNNTIAYALAYAILIGVKRVSLFGADYTYPNRNFAESGRACVESWIMVMKALDIEVRLSPGTSLFDNAGRVGNSGENLGHEMYGYDIQPVIDLGDGKTLHFGKPEHERIRDEVAALMADGIQKNAARIEELDRRMKTLMREDEAKQLEERLQTLKRQEVEDAVSTPQPGTECTPAGSPSADPAGEDEAETTPVSGRSVRGRGSRRKPAKGPHNADPGKRRGAGVIPGTAPEAVAAGKGRVSEQPGEVAAGPAE